MTEKKSQAFRRRQDQEAIVVGDYYDKTRRYFDATTEYTVVKVFSGEYYIAKEPHEMLVTILGSCVAACIRDPLARVGGMNHFLLPGDGLVSSDLDNASAATRYGAFAMEQLINGLLALGAARERMEVKVFGGGNVIKSSTLIGEKNVGFVREFLRKEGLRIASEHLGGKLPRKIHYYPDTGKVMMRELRRKDDLKIVEEETQYAQKICSKPVEGDIELF